MKRISTKPTKRLIQLSVIPLTFALAHALYALYLHLAGGQITTATQSMLNQAWGLIVFVLSAIALTDYFASRKAPKLELKRRCKDILSLHRWADVTLDIQSRTQQKTTHLVISELNDNALELSDTKVECEIKPDKATRLNYKVRANRRGDAYISGSHLLMLSDLKLWQSVWQVEHQSKFKVYPDFQAISGYTLLALDNNVSGFGIKRKPRRGEGMEFHQLREYQKEIPPGKSIGRPLPVNKN